MFAVIRKTSKKGKVVEIVEVSKLREKRSTDRKPTVGGERLTWALIEAVGMKGWKYANPSFICETREELEGRRAEFEAFFASYDLATGYVAPSQEPAEPKKARKGKKAKAEVAAS